MIDERLEEQAADKAHLTVTPDEVDNGIRTVASQNKMDPKQLVVEAKKQGLTEQDYRDEVRRQVLEGKLIQLRVRARVRVTEQDAKNAYAKYVSESSKQHPVDLRILVLQVPAGSSQQTAEARAALGEELSRRARSGEDFCQLVLAYSDDQRTKATCGSNGPVPLNILLPELQTAATTLKPGETSAPIIFRDPQGQQAVLITQLSSQPFTIPPYDQVKEQMFEQAYIETTERQRKMWLLELRHGVYVDVRL
jgi:peptidyl-prolyl cis-trans isomerase SurA